MFNLMKMFNSGTKKNRNGLNSIAGTALNSIASSIYLGKQMHPRWNNLSEDIYLLNTYLNNPIVNTIINIKAEAFSNMKFIVEDLKTGELTPLEKYQKDNGALYNLLKKPNPLQSTKEWLKQSQVNYEIFGNRYTYRSVPDGFETSETLDYSDISLLQDLSPYNVAPILTGNWLEATEKNEIIKEYQLRGFNNKTHVIDPSNIMHLNNTNVVFDTNFTKGCSNLLSMKMPISNIQRAYESRNVIITNRGASGIISPQASKTEVSTEVTMNDDEQEEIQEKFQKYGLLGHQWAQIISKVPLNYQKIESTVKDLMLFEEVEADAIAIANCLGVPELLVKYYIKGGTFNNLDASEKRLYNSTIIPESSGFIQDLNVFLNLHNNDIQLVSSYSHLNLFKKNQREEAQTKKEIEITMRSAFSMGAITYNQYLIAMDLPIDSEIGDKRIWDLDDRQLMVLNIKTNKNG